MRWLQSCFFITMMLLAGLTDLSSQSAGERSPVLDAVIVSGENSYPAVLLRRQHSMIWIKRTLSDGNTVETAVKLSDVDSLRMERPAWFDMIAAGELQPEHRLKGVARLRRLLLRAEAYRDIPGVLADEIEYLLGCLYEQTENWVEALTCFHSLVSQEHEHEYASLSRLKRGMCLIRIGEYEKGLADLNIDDVPGTDLTLLADFYTLRGRALAAGGQYEDAALSYLYPAVFYPDEGENELTGLAAAMRLMVPMEDWRGLRNMMKQITDKYPDTEEAEEAARLMEEYAQQLSGEKQYDIE